MNLLCPNCQKMLTVPEEYAGQPMRCPLCQGTFTVPPLPGGGGAPPPAAPGPPDQGDVYSFRNEAEPAPPPPVPPPEPHGQDLHAPPHTPAAEEGAPPPTPPAPPEGYRQVGTIWFSPRVIRWVAPVAVVLIFILQFFPWVEVALGDFTLLTQNAWGAAFGTGKIEVPGLSSGEDKKTQPPTRKPDASALMIVYLIPLFLPTLLLTIAFFVPELRPVKFPAAVEPILPWRWLIVAALNAFVFLFLCLQLVLHFSAEGKTDEIAEQEFKVGDTRPMDSTNFYPHVAWQDASHRTIWLRFAFVLHLVAIAGALFMYWAQQRGDKRPLPRLDFLR